MREVIIYARLNMETLKWEEVRKIPYNGKWEMCLGGLSGMFGATKEDKGISNAERDFMDTMQAEQSTQFANETKAQNEVQQAWAPIVAGGAYQYGFSTAEDQQLQKNIEEQGAQATENTVAATELRQQQESGGAETAPTGAQEAIEAQARETGAQATATALGQEKELGYETGRQLFQAGTGAEEDVAKLADPTAYGNVENTAASNALAGQKYVDTMNANSLTAKLVGGAIGGGLQALSQAPIGGPLGTITGEMAG